MASFVLGAFGGGTDADVHGGIDGVGDVGADAGGDLGGIEGDHAPGHHGAHMSPFNLSTISAFLAWFGGAGYLLQRYSSLGAILVVGASLAAGLAGGGIVFLVLSRYVLPRLTSMRPEDYVVEGAIGRVTSTIMAGGTGEIVYTLGGSQQVDGARSVRSGEVIERGAEVVVMRREAGILYVDRWDRLSGDPPQLPPGEPGAA